MRTKSIFLIPVIISVIISCNKTDNPKEIEAVKKVIIAEGEARQEGDQEMLKKIWAHEPYIAHFGASKNMCFVFRGWETFEKIHSNSGRTSFNEETNVVRDNIDVHINGNTAFVNFDLHIYDPAGTIEAKVNASLEKIDGEWRLVFLNVIDENSFRATDSYWPF